MNNNNQIIIDKVIIHKVDHRNYDAPILSDLESPVSEEVASFLKQHIVSNREHKFTRTATFVDLPTDRSIFKVICNELLNKPDQFISQSKSIANHLFKTIKEDKRVSPSDLVVCTFTEGEGSYKWLALLKLDPEDGFIGEREDVNGLIRIILKRVPDVLPSGELQKCAFILPENLRRTQGYHLKVLDQQATRYGGRRLIASFFIKDFLQCKIGLKREDRTRTFIYGSYEWVDLKKEEWSEEDVIRFKNRIRLSVQDDIVDITEVSQAVITKPEEQEEYHNYMLDQGLEELVFEPDPEERKRLTQYIWFEGDNGLKVRIKADAVGPNKTLSYKKDESTNTWNVIIRSATWKMTTK